ncbi:hypothetical protein Ga0466249_004753 [Sporomusaceae bacterium BoRhaA]|uniref:PD-(D/E)XK nuclease-like domain-containing protein n=1 Tax=Pelorhabdus rhamnosifermentans TaxID=2772457 RepID=UPI001C05F65A|nr:PD-(D/E)XK nuclease-like domain-containing protein [Pelorhabdus rhamnosifermentans]MBU2703608.1 hypothetical protein [Pelorhabdus rhamnosifermentans]
MILTHENYHSKEANIEYMGVSQYKSFRKCEADTMHWLTTGNQEDTDALMVGKYVHKWSEGPEAFEQFKADNSGYIYNKKGEPYKSFIKADEMINCLKSDDKVKFYLQGSKEVILTAELFGTPWKIMIDVDNDKLNYLLDLKTTKSISEWGWVWSPDESRNIKVPFIEEWQYLIQAAVYSEVERIARDRDKPKDFYMIAVSKEKIPDHAIIDLTDPVRMEAELLKIKENLPHILKVKSGEIEPARCEHCDYCRSTKKVDKIIHYTELREAW